MLLPFKKLFFNFTFNLSLFCILIIGIQNSSNKSKSKVNLIIDESIKLPISFIIGTSFISGSIVGSLLPISSYRKNKDFL